MPIGKMDKVWRAILANLYNFTKITASELLHDVHRAKEPSISQKRLRFVEYILDLFPVIPFDLEIARVHAQLWADLQTNGQSIGAHDLIIAATAY